MEIPDLGKSHQAAPPPESCAAVMCRCHMIVGLDLLDLTCLQRIPPIIILTRYVSIYIYGTNESNQILRISIPLNEIMELQL